MHAKALRISILLAQGYLIQLPMVRPPVVKSRAGAQFDFTLAAWQLTQLAGLQPDPHTAGPSAKRVILFPSFSSTALARNEKI